MWIVTGAAGFIGSHLCRRLVEDGEHVVGVDSLNSYYDTNLKNDRLALLAGNENFEFLHLDLSDLSSCLGLFERFQGAVVVHLAAQAGVRYSISHPQSYGKNNLEAFLNVLEGCRISSCQHLVFASSSSVYGSTSKLPFATSDPADHPVSLYAATKRANELMAHSYAHLYGLPCSGLRFFTVYGPWGRPDMAYYKFANRIMNDTPINIYGDGSFVRDFTYVDDIVEGILRVASKVAHHDASWDSSSPHLDSSSAPWQIFNIGHGQQATVNELIEILEEALGRPAIRIYEDVSLGDVPVTHADTRALTRYTGYTPTTTLRDGMKRFASWFLQHGASYNAFND